MCIHMSVYEYTYNILTHTLPTTTTTAYLVLFGFLVSLPVYVIALVTVNRKLSSGEWDKYTTIIGTCIILGITSIIAFLTCSLSSINSGWNEIMVWPFLFLTLVVGVGLLMVFHVLRALLTRDACYFDSLYTGVNRFSLYGIAIGQPASLFSSFVFSFSYVLLSAADYEEVSL